MALLDDIKLSLRIMSDDFDAEVQMLADAAIVDMDRVGVLPALLELDEEGNLANGMVKTAVVAYVKAHFGYDNPESDRFDEAYRRIVCDLLNSAYNSAASEEE